MWPSQCRTRVPTTSASCRRRQCGGWSGPGHAILRCLIGELIGLFRDRPLQSEPGALYDYSNSGYDVLGAVVEKVSGRPWDAFLEDEVFRPLGMADTAYDRPGLVVKGRAAGYAGRPGESLFNAAPFEPSNGYAAGGLYATVEDLYRWNRALDGGTLLGPASREAMFRPNKRSYAYGWAVLDVGGGHTVATHGGSVPGFSACVARYPSADLYVAVLSNVQARPVCALVRELATAVLGP
jgi:CubicO group peptidase (beta-lactamase class C family)